MDDTTARGTSDAELTIGTVIPAPWFVQAEPVGARLPEDIAVVAAGAALDVAELLADALRDLTGFAVPVRPEGPGITLTLRPDAQRDDTEDRDREGTQPEGYELTVGPSGVAITATAPAGLFYGVQSLLQLLPTGPDWVIPGGRIVDQARLPYRGLMLDVARHFFTVAQVCRMVDLAARYKLNHLHLHLSDDQGWRIAVNAWPRLAGYGGGTEVGDGPGGYYSQDDYREIVAYAGRRFVTVVPEIDLPGHTNAALASYPELNPDGVAPPRYTGIEVGFSALDVASELTYTFLDTVFGELAALTPGPYLHIGGDEAKTLDPDRYAIIVNRAQELVAGHAKIAIGWHEIAAAKLEPSTVVQFWGALPDSPDVVAAGVAGNRVIMSPADHAYLDMQYDEASPIGLSWAGYVSVRQAYEWDPLNLVPGLDPAAVLGLECPLWTETAETSADLEYLAFPRLTAIAELGWSSPASHDWESFRTRLAAQAPAWAALGLNYYPSPEIDWR
jgi:hexosaminidase